MSFICTDPRCEASGCCGGARVDPLGTGVAFTGRQCVTCFFIVAAGRLVTHHSSAGEAAAVGRGEEAGRRYGGYTDNWLLRLCVQIFSPALILKERRRLIRGNLARRLRRVDFCWFFRRLFV